MFARLKSAEARLLGAFIIVLGVVTALVSGPKQLFAALGIVYGIAWLGYRLVSSAPSREWRIQAFLVHMSMAFVLVGFEAPVLVGMLDYRDIFKPPMAPMHDPRNVLDMELLFRRAPGTHVKGKADGGDFGFVFHTEDSEELIFDAKFDKTGFRNPESMTQADIVFVGDSFTEALPVPYEDLVSSQLGAIYGVQAANYGMMTYGPYQERVTFTRYGLPLKPKVLVWLFFEGNDLGDVRYWEWATKDLIGLHEDYHGIIHRSFTMNAPRILYHMLRSFKPSGYERSGLAAAADGTKERVYFLHNPKPVDEKVEKALSTTKTILTDVYEICKKNDIRLVVGFIPTKYRVYHDITTFHDGAVPPTWKITEIPERMEKIVRGISDDVLWVNLLEPLRKSAAAGRRPYYRVDSHWNPVGHVVATEALHKAIKSLDVSTSSVTPIDPVTQSPDAP